MPATTRSRPALQAGFTRFRPVLMTALAMIIGMVPMALGLGEGGEQNAPLGRAVIGGLIFATVATLFFVPTVFTIIHGRERGADPSTLRRVHMPEPSSAHHRRALVAHDASLRAAALAWSRCVLGAWGEISRVLARNALAGRPPRDALPTVVTVNREPHRRGEDLVLPGTVQAFVEAPIYARTSGYLKTWYTDIGCPVKKGQLLAEIETPEVDQQLRQAQADLATARANEHLSNSTNVRWQALLATESVSKQDADEKAGDAAAKKPRLRRPRPTSRACGIWSPSSGCWRPSTASSPRATPISAR